MPIKLNIRQGVKDFLNKPLPNFLQKPVSSLNTGMQNFSQTGVGKVVTAPLRLGGTGGERVGSALNYYAGNKEARQSDFVEPVKALLQQPKVFASRLGEAAAQPFVSKQEEEISNQAIDQADLYTKKAIEFSKAGDKQKADQYFQMSRDILDKQRGRTDERLGDLESSKQELIKSGTDTAKLALMAYSPTSALKGGVIGGTLRSALSDEPQAMSEGFLKGLTTGAVTGASKVVIAGLLDRFGDLAPLANNKFAREFIGRNIAGGFNILEDRIIDKLNKEDPSWQKDLFSYIIGVVLGGGSKEGDWEKLKSEMRIGLDDKDMELVRQVFNDVSENVTWTVKYKQGADGQLEPVISLKNQDTLGDVKLLTRDEAIKNNLNVLPEGQEEAMVKQFKQGGFARLGSEPEVPSSDLTKQADTVTDQARQAEIEGQQQRSFLETIQEDPTQPDGKLKEGISELEQKYITHTNEEAMKWVDQKISSDGLDKTIEWARNVKVKDLETDGDKVGAIAVQAIKKYEAMGNYDQAIALADEFDQIFRGGGRLVQAVSMWTNLSPNAMIRHAEKTFEEANKRVTKFGTVELTDDLKNQIVEEMKRISSLETEAQRVAGILNVKKLIAQQIPPSAVEWVDAYRYNNMLSGPGTQYREFTGDFIQTYITRPALLATRGVQDWFKSTLTGSERKHYVSDVPEYYKGVLRSFGNAVEGFKMAMAGDVKMGRVAQETGVAGEMDIMSSVRLEKTPKAITLFSRMMDSIERFNSALISGGEYAVQIKNGATEEQALKEADKVAQYFLFKDAIDPKNQTGQGLVLTGIDNTTKLIYNARNAPVIGPVISAFIPFISTSMNIFKQQLEYSPAGIATTIGSADKGGQLSKALLGSTATLIGWQLIQNGDSTWQVPRGEEEKALFYASGRRPFSVKIGDKWIPYHYFGVFGTALALPAAVNYYQSQSKTAITDSQSKKLEKTLQAIFQYYNDETFLAGLNALTEVASGETSIPEALGFASRQLIPYGSLLAFVSNVIDPIYRQADGFWETIQRDLPGMSQELQPYLDPDGKESKRHWSYYLLPYVIGDDKPEYSQRLDELQRIQQVQEVPAWYKRELSDIQESIQNIYKNVEMSDEEREKRLEKENKKLKDLQEKYEILIPKMQDALLQQPRMQEPTSPNRGQESPPAQLEPTLPPVERKRLVI